MEFPTHEQSAELGISLSYLLQSVGRRSLMKSATEVSLVDIADWVEFSRREGRVEEFKESCRRDSLFQGLFSSEWLWMPIS
ncbi:MAG: hypothetical protein ACI8P0_004746 [Planctomycetaceae bacterium]|jgi:hypothetical protein